MAGTADLSLQSNRKAAKQRSDRLLYEFNLLPAVYADRSWLEACCGTGAFGNQPDHAACIEQSTLLLKHHGLSENFDWSARAATVRLAFLQTTAFSRICTVIGLMGAAAEIRQTVNGGTLRSLEATFGELLEAVWAQESLLVSRAGVSYSLLKHTEQERLEVARNAGFRMYKSLLHAEGQAPESSTRALFKLPMAIATESVTPIDTAVVKPVMRWVCRSAIKRWEPSWAWLF